MLFTAILVIASLVAAIAGRRTGTIRDHARWGMAAAMVIAGLSHLFGPTPFVQHLPDWLPGREPLVYASGLVEIGLGLALVGTWLSRALAGRVLALYLVAVWPANIYVAAAGVDVDGQPDGAYAWVRLPFQLLFIAWALWSTRTSDDRATESTDLVAVST